jgi:predicted enzyme related to lactoylglutathione lyase
MEAVLYVVNMPRCVAFYRFVLDLKLDRAEDGFCVLSAPGTTLTLVQVPDHIAIGIQIGDPPERRSDTPIKLVFGVADIDATRVLAAQWGGYIDGADAQWQWAGTPRCDGVDPEGNVLQVSQGATP